MSWKLNIEDNDKAEFIGNILDVFDDFLEKNEIKLPRSEKEKADDSDFLDGNSAVIYGADYEELSNEFSGIFDAWTKEIPVFVILRVTEQSSYTEPHYFEAAQDAADLIAYASSEKEAEAYLDKRYTRVGEGLIWRDPETTESYFTIQQLPHLSEEPVRDRAVQAEFVLNGPKETAGILLYSDGTLKMAIDGEDGSIHLPSEILSITQVFDTWVPVADEVIGD